VFDLEKFSHVTAAHPLSPDEAAAQWALLSHNGGHRIAHRLFAYLDERVRYAGRWHGAVREWHRRPGRIHRGRAAPAHRIAGQLKKLVTAVASSGEADVARFW
jgi:hypothetical protein